MSNLNENERTCENCSNIFNLIYTDRQGYKYQLDTKCCSKSCATSLIRSITKDQLEEKALNFIRQKNEYCTGREIYNGIKHSSKTFTQHGVQVSDLNHSLGFIKPKSKFQETVGKILKKEFSNIETEKKFDGLVGNTGYSLRVDFYIPSENMVVEADKSQHNDPKHPWKEWKNGTVKDYDEIKDKFFKEQGITMVRVPYKRNLKESDILSRLSQTSES